MRFQFSSEQFIKQEEFEERFLQVGIGYRVLGGIKFYERAEIKDAVSYLRIINQKFDDLARKSYRLTKKRNW